MTYTRNMKLWICVVCLASPLVSPAPPVSLKLDIIDMAAISRMTPQQLEALAEGLAAEEIMRTKRSSAQTLKSVAAKASSGLLQKKIGFLTQAAAGSASYLSSSSSKFGGSSDSHGGYHYEAPAPQDEKVDFLGLKKSILYTLFQAVKAITGGVTILKGQIIKGGGALAATLGKLISKKGDVVSNLGKKIVSSAALSQKPTSTAAGPVYGPPPSVHAEYGPPTAYGSPTAPAHYSHAAVSAPTGFAHKYPSQLDGWGKLNGVHAGLVILTPLEGHNEAYPPVKTPLEPPSSIIGNVFSAFKDILSSKTPSVESSPSYLPTAATGPGHSGGDTELNYQVPPPMPYQGMSAWALNSYGEPAVPETFHDYDPRQVQPLPHAASKRLAVPHPISHQKTLTLEKIQKINANLEKVRAYLAESPEARTLEDVGRSMENSLTPTKDSANLVDNEIGVLSADQQLPVYVTTTSTEAPVKDKIDNQKDRRKKEVKFILRGNKIVQV